MTQWEPGQHVQGHQQAEEMAAHHMRRLGHPDARATPVGPDGGIDVRARSAIAQVKMESTYTGRPALQRLYGARADDRHLQLWFFSATNYTRDALTYADGVGMILLTWDHQGRLTARNAAAERALAWRSAPPTAHPVAGRTAGPVVGSTGRPRLVPSPDTRMRASSRERRRPGLRGWLLHHALRVVAVLLLLVLVGIGSNAAELDAASPVFRDVFAGVGTAFVLTVLAAIGQGVYRSRRDEGRR
ncbi:hypothetical protein C8046_11875 [Serinibacter arcticus]|uniref:Restriction endonuclease type IV Mrr domain-containing protein n=1 Tax=Serinibacter arcticus TaxID=1655435 RepID=A0A2U1ZW91_9MICO|nr:restriction endonuclease [Serinibacter arcticus]PWD51248.1 hypothetical protein C8046_11875 [Serinibacter arcticus]